MGQSSDSCQKLSKGMFCLLFPVVFIYNAAVEYGAIPAFIGGGIGVFIIVTFYMLFGDVLYDSRQLKQKTGAYFKVFITLLLYVLSYLIFHYLFGDSFHRRADVLAQWIILVGSWAAFFSIGYFWPKQLSSIEVYILLGLLLIMSILVFQSLHYLHSDPSKSILALGRVNSSQNLMSYQGYARLLSVTGLVVLAVIRKQLVFWTVSIVIISSLLLIGSRSEILGVIIIFPVLIYYHYVVSPKSTIIATLVVVVVSSTLIAANFRESNYVRHMELFNIYESKSFQYRQQLNSEAVQAILEKPVKGDFSGHVRKHKGTGFYAHSIVSSWRQLGLMGFILYSTLMLWPVIAIFSLLRRNPKLLQIDVLRISAVLSVYMLLLSLGAKSVFSSVFALSWGMYLAALKYTESVKNI